MFLLSRIASAALMITALLAGASCEGQADGRNADPSVQFAGGISRR